MPSKVQLQVNNFIQGLITENNQLTTPEKASLDEINMQLLRDGSRRRRLGLDIEDGGALVDTDYTTNQLAIARHSFFSWPTPSGSTKVHIGIIQLGNRLYFIDLLAASPSTVQLNGGGFITANTSLDVYINFTLYNGDVVGVSEELDKPFILTYNDDTDVVTASGDDLRIRDIYGVDDGLAINARPETLSTEHLYNLGNQGWSEEIQTTCTTGSAVLQCTFDTIDVYPSNADTWSLGKNADVSDADIDRYDPELLKRNSIALGRAARGRFIINLYNRGASRNEVLASGTLPADRELGRVSTLAAYAGRIFYSGIRSRIKGGDNLSPQLSGAVLFSQIARTTSDLYKCYQEADPSSPEQSDLVDTDGGVIIIPGASGIVRLVPVKTSLFVFAGTGVWQIKGEEGGFKATSFQVQKISSVGTESPLSIIEANGIIFYWARGGIYSLSPDQFGESYEANNITLITIQSLYTSLPALVKKNAKGFYDEDENIVRWLYGSDANKIVGDPIDLQPEAPLVPLVGPVAAITGEGFVNPMVSRLTDTTGIIIYRAFTGGDLKGVVATIGTDLSVTLGVETDLGLPSGSGGHTVTYISDNKVLVVSPNTSAQLVARVMNISGTTITPATSATINSEVTPSQADPCRVDMVGTAKAVVSFKSNVGGIPALQVIDISATDIITAGLVYKNANMTGTTHNDVSMLSLTSGIMMSSSGSRVSCEHFSLSGTIITFNGTVYSFLTATQLAGGFSYALGSIRKIDANSCMVYGLLTHAVNGYSSAPTNFVLSESSGVLTGGVILVDTTATVLNLTSYRPGTLSTSLSRSFVSGSTYIPALDVNSIADPSLDAINLSYGEHLIVGFPEAGVITSNIMLAAWEGTATGVVIEAGALRIGL